MNFDCTGFPADYTFAEIISDKLGLYVRVANFTEHRGQRMFRMIVDPEISKAQMRELLFSTIKDSAGSYEFSHLESLQGIVVDDINHMSPTTTYLRITFM